jgi:hypothetical protein
MLTQAPLKSSTAVAYVPSPPPAIYPRLLLRLNMIWINQALLAGVNFSQLLHHFNEQQ